MDRLLFGDNQFFGINHVSEDKAREQSIRFRDIQAVIDILDEAYSEGLRSFMCTTHDRIALVCDHVRGNPQRYVGFAMLPCMPYAHKYANAVTDYGMLGAMKRFLPEEGFLDAVVRGGLSLTTKDIEGVTTLLIDSEMKMFHGVSTPVIFLQNVVVDFLLGLGLKDAFHIFASHVRTKYDAEPGFLTMNLPRLVRVLAEVQVANPIIGFSFNKAGFRMCGGKAAYDQVLERKRFRAIAMSVFASGAIVAEEAIRWICEQPHIDSIVFGASTRANIRHTRALVDRYWAKQPYPGHDGDKSANLGG
jgi:hypothetical protein